MSNAEDKRVRGAVVGHLVGLDSDLTSPAASAARPAPATVASTGSGTGQGTEAPGTPIVESASPSSTPERDYQSGTSAPPAAEISGKSGSNGRGNLKRGGIHEHVAAKREREAARAERAQSRAGILEILREIVQDGDEVGAYRVAASKLLLAPEVAPPERIVRVFSSTEEWLEAIERKEREEETRTDWTFPESHRCPTCKRCGEACHHLKADGSVRPEYSATERAKLAKANGGAKHE